MAILQQLQPLPQDTPIVDENRMPTIAFQQWWQQLFSNAETTQGDVTGKVPLTRMINTTAPIAGGGSLENDLTLSLNDTAVTPGTYGDATNVGQFTVDQKGRITAASDVPISGGGGGGVPDYFGMPNFRPNAATTFGVNNFGCRSIIVPGDCDIHAVAFWCVTAQATADALPGVYAPTATGTIGALLATGPEVTGITAGLNVLPLTTPLSVTKGQAIWIGFQLTIIATALATVNALDTAFFGGSGAALPDPAPAATYGTGASMCMWARTSA